MDPYPPTWRQQNRTALKTNAKARLSILFNLIYLSHDCMISMCLDKKKPSKMLDRTPLYTNTLTHMSSVQANTSHRPNRDNNSHHSSSSMCNQPRSRRRRSRYPRHIQSSQCSSDSGRQQIVNRFALVGFYRHILFARLHHLSIIVCVLTLLQFNRKPSTIIHRFKYENCT